MDNQEEYQDPDYHESSAAVKKPSHVVSEEEKLEKIKKIIRREFANEIEAREKEVTTIDQRVTKARRILHKLRYALVNNYYKQQRLQLSSGQLQDDLEIMSQVQAKPELSALLRDGQNCIHPSVRKLLGKKTVDFNEIFKTREPRNKIRKNYHAMLKSKNVTTPADSTKTLRPVSKNKEMYESEVQSNLVEDPWASKPKKVPRHIDPKIVNVFSLDEATRNKMKQRYRIIIGNTSKYAPPASRADRSTHKWLLYIRGPASQPDISRVVTAATVRLHPSYAPHHFVRLHKPPFHVSRRGWGEFPAKIELHFAQPSRNRPSIVEHTIKLDRNYTGLQTLGGETVIDVWLYSTPEMLKYEFTESNNEDAILKPTIEPQTDTQDISKNVHGVITNKQTYPQKDIEKEQLNKKNDILVIKEEVEDTEESNDIENQSDSWMDFFSKNTTEVNVDEMLVKTENRETLTDPEDTTKHTMVLTLENDSIQLNNKADEIESQEMETDTYIDKTNLVDDNTLEVPMENLNQAMLTKKRIVQYVEPTTGKIYYLEMDRKVNLSTVQEIAIASDEGVKTVRMSRVNYNNLRNFRRSKKMESLLKPELKDNQRTDDTTKCAKTKLRHIKHDHSYFSKNREVDDQTEEHDNFDVETDAECDCECEITVLESIQEAVLRFTNVRMVVDYMLKKIPIISEDVRKQKYFPFVVESEERYWKLDFAKRRNIEWSRAKFINKMLLDRFNSDENVWRTKQILIYSRLHGYNPIRTENIYSQTQINTEEWSSWNDMENSRRIETNIKEIYPNVSDISTLTVFDGNEFIPFTNSEFVDLTDCEEEIDVVGTECEMKPKLPEVTELADLTALPVENEEDRLRFLFIERKCADIGIELRNEDVGNGFSYSAVHAVLLSAMKSFAEELIRSALAVKLSEERDLEYLPTVWVGSPPRAPVSLEHAWGAARAGGRLRALSAAALAARARRCYAPL